MFDSVKTISLLPLFTYKVLKQFEDLNDLAECLLPLFTYKVLKLHG